MKKVILKILAEDIRRSSYINSQDCAVTRALKRAGIDAVEGGGEIVHNTLKVDRDITTPKGPLDQVLGMYASLQPTKDTVAWINVAPREIKDFEFELEIPDTW